MSEKVKLKLPVPAYEYDEFGRAYFPVKSPLREAIQNMFKSGYSTSYVLQVALKINAKIRVEDILKLKVPRKKSMIQGKKVLRLSLPEDFKEIVLNLLSKLKSHEKVLALLHEQGHTELLLEDIKHLKLKLPRKDEKKMKKLSAKIGILILACIFSSSAMGGGGGLTGGATELTQMLNNSELMTQVTQLYEQINNQITMIQDMIQNTLSLPDQLFGNVTQIYSKIKGIMDKTQGLVFTMSNIDQEMKNRFKSYSSMSGMTSTADYQKEYRKIVDTQMETARTTMEALGVAHEQLEKDDTKALEQLQNLAKTAKGRNQIAQATNQFLSFLSEESLKTRQLMMTQTQMMTVAMEAERAAKDTGQKLHEESLTNLTNPFSGVDGVDLSSPKW